MHSGMFPRVPFLDKRGVMDGRDLNLRKLVEGTDQFMTHQNCANEKKRGKYSPPGHPIRMSTCEAQALHCAYFIRKISVVAGNRLRGGGIALSEKTRLFGTP